MLTQDTCFNTHHEILLSNEWINNTLLNIQIKVETFYYNVAMMYFYHSCISFFFDVWKRKLCCERLLGMFRCQTCAACFFYKKTLKICLWRISFEEAFVNDSSLHLVRSVWKSVCVEDCASVTVTSLWDPSVFVRVRLPLSCAWRVTHIFASGYGAIFFYCLDF